MSQSRFTFSAVQPFVSLAVRLAAGVIMTWAGFAKIADLPQSVRATRAYELLPESVVPLVGNALPFLEIVLGFLLLFGLATRWSAIVYLAMMAAFIFGISWAWAHGLSIDCGCFGGGGAVEAGTTDYPGHLIERAGYVVLGAWLAIWPKSALSLDGFLARSRQRVAAAAAAAEQSD